MIIEENLEPGMTTINGDTLLGWVVWYSNGNGITTYSSKTHKWLDLPKIGVQYMYRIYDGYMEQVSGSDYYCPYQLMDVGNINPWIKFGIMIDQQIIGEIFEQVVNFQYSDF